MRVAIIFCLNSGASNARDCSACSADTADGARRGLAIFTGWRENCLCMAVVDSAGIRPFAVCRRFGTLFAPTEEDCIPKPPGNGAAADGRGVTADVIDMQ